jgi:hypothetical protein
MAQPNNNNGGGGGHNHNHGGGHNHNHGGGGGHNHNGGGGHNHNGGGGGGAGGGGGEETVAGNTNGTPFIESNITIRDVLKAFKSRLYDKESNPDITDFILANYAKRGGDNERAKIERLKEKEIVFFVGGVDRNNIDFGTDTIKIWCGSERRFIQDNRRLKSWVRREYPACCKLLNDTGFFISGGYSFLDTQGPLSECEKVVFNLQSNTFTSTVHHMIFPRYRHASVLLFTGEILIIGGRSDNEPLPKPAYIPYNEVVKFSYDQKELKFEEDKKCVHPRYGHTAHLATNGRVYVFGGKNDKHEELLMAEKFNVFSPLDLPSNVFEVLANKMIHPRFGHTSVALDNNRILIVGGESSSMTTEIFDIKTESFTEGPKLVQPKVNHFSFLMADGNVLIGGGDNDSLQLQIYHTSKNKITISDDKVLDERMIGASSVKF